MNKALYIVAAILLFLMGLFVGTFYDQYLSDELREWAFFGDTLSGTLGVLISGLAVWLVYKTYTLQDEELRRTHESIWKQNLDSTFFNLLNRKDKKVGSIKYANNEGITALRPYIQEAKKRIPEDGVQKTIQFVMYKKEGALYLAPYLSSVKSLAQAVQLGSKNPSEKTESVNLEQIFKNSFVEREINALFIFLRQEPYKDTFNYMNEIGIFETVAKNIRSLEGLN